GNAVLVDDIEKKEKLINENLVKAGKAFYGDLKEEIYKILNEKLDSFKMDLRTQTYNLLFKNGNTGMDCRENFDCLAKISRQITALESQL
ncbi:hypothetical protein ACFL35_18940, partial [Candidatus Riflebacteria bacterium]